MEKIHIKTKYLDNISQLENDAKPIIESMKLYDYYHHHISFDEELFGDIMVILICMVTFGTIVFLANLLIGDFSIWGAVIAVVSSLGLCFCNHYFPYRQALKIAPERVKASLTKSSALFPLLHLFEYFIEHSNADQKVE